MATQTLYQEHYLALTRTVKQWDQRLRLRQSLLWLPLSVVPGLVLGCAIAIAARLRPLLLPEQIAQIAGAGAVLGLIAMLIAVWLWRRAPLTSARRFDLLFRLDERVSTALEISTGSIQTNDELAARQLEDARARAGAVRVRDHLPLTLRRNDWLTALALLLLLVLLLVLPNPQTTALAQASAQQAAITEAAETLRNLTEDTAADANLSDADRRALLEELRRATETLEQQNVTPEEAFAALSDVQSSLQSRANDLSQQASANQAAMQQAADALRQAGQQPNGGNQNQSAAASADQMSQSLDQMSQNAGSMSDAERQAAEDALRSAAESLQDTNPQAAQQLSQAAENLQAAGQQSDPQQGQTQNGDSQSAQDAQQNLQQAQQELQRQSQETQQQRQQSESLQQAADQTQQSAEQVKQAQQNQESGQPSQTNPQGQSQAGQPQQPNPSSQSQPQTGQQGQQSGNQQSQDAQSMQAIQNGSNAGQQGGDPQDQQAPNSASSGAGDSPGGAGDDSPGAQSEQGQIDTNNNPDGTGERQFESVNVPRHIGGDANPDNNIQLPSDPNAPVQEGNFAENPNGQVTVPYNQVFSDYASEVNRALNSDYVPLGLRDVVRDYFTSLEPKP